MVARKMLQTFGIAALLSITLVGAMNSSVIPGMYLVEFSDGHDNTSFFASLQASGFFPTPRMNLNHTLFKGASFRINNDAGRGDQQVSMIAAMPAVKTVWPLRNYSIPDVRRRNFMMNPNATIAMLEDAHITNEEAKTRDTFSTHVMTQVDRLHAQGNTGQGIRIGIVDTGVDYTHHALGGCFGKNCLISYGYDLVGDDWEGLEPPSPDDDPFDDCIGHGTHVSGIIAAQPNKMNFTGVAPGATLGMYKVFSCASFGTTDDVLISAFNMAFEQGSDIITASIGGQIGWSEVPWSVAVSRIVDAGVPCTVAAGNSGAMGLFASSNAADGLGVTAVASFDNTVTPKLLPTALYEESAKHSQTDNADSHGKTGFGWQPSYPFFRNVSLPLMALSNDTTVTADACATLPGDTPDLSQYAVLIRLGGCDANVKVANAVAKKAANIVFYADESSGLPAYFLGDPFDVHEPLNGSGTVTAALGAAWVESLNRGADIQLTFVDPIAADVAYLQVPNNLTGGFVSSFTSWGPTWDLAIYPTIGAPGGNILSTFPMSMGGYAVESGTSMATPFTAGVYALVSQIRNKSINPTELASLVSSTAKANFWNDGGGSLRDLAPVAQQGPGLIQAYDAAYATTLVSKSSISFNDSDHTPVSVELIISNEGSDTITYELGNIPALGMYMMQIDMLNGGYAPAHFPNPIFAASAGVNFSESTVNIRPKARAMISVSLIPPTNDNEGLDEASLPVYSGYISVNGSDGSNLTIPYMGVAGSLYEAQNLDPGSTNLGCGSGTYGSSDYEPGYCRYGNASFTLPYPTGQLDAYDYYSGSYGYPSVSAILSLGSALVRADVVPLSHNYSGFIMTVLGRRTAGSIYGFPQAYLDRDLIEVPFNGMLADGSVVPEGRYGLLVRVLRLFGNPDVEDDYDSVTEIPFALHYENSSSSSVTAMKGMSPLGSM
ncbi:unnamed protein product [Discula destructiva]